MTSGREGGATPYRVGYLVGSVASNSINRLLAGALVKLAPPGLDLVEIPLKDLPLYSYDYDEDYPPAGRALKEALGAVDAVLLVTPEYNRSVPAALKNAIDWGSRLRRKNSFAGKPSAVIGMSPGSLGTAIAQQHLRSVLATLDSPQMPSPEGYIRYTKGLITEDGRVTDETTEAFLRKFLTAFQGFIEQVLPAAPEG